jgi:hypothetical protein
VTTYTFRLTATGIAELKTQLEQLGPAGQAAFDKIQQGAQRATTGTTNFTGAADRASTGSRNFGSVIGQAGFQLQDFAIQVQSGTSALTAFAQQGSQLLGVFGTGGAVAGAVLAIGAIAAQLLLAADATDKLSEAQKQLIQDLEKLEDLGDTEADAQQRRIDRNREEAASVYARAKAELTAYEDRLVRERRDTVLIADSLRGDVRAGLKDAPDLLREQEQRIAATDAVLERLRGRLSGIEADYDRTFTQVGRNALEKTLEWAQGVSRTVENENAKSIEKQEDQNAAFRQREQRAALDALIKRVNDEEREREKAAERALNIAQRTADREFDAQQRAAERFAEGMSRTLSGVFEDALDEGGMRSFWSVFENLGRRALANILGEIATQQFALPISQAVLGTGAAGATVGFGGAVNTAGSIASLGNLASGGGLLGAANSYLFGTGAVGALGPQIPTAGIFGSGGTLFGSASLASAALPIAGLAAAVILPKLLAGGGRGDPYSQGSIALGADGRLSGYAAADNLGDPAKLQQSIDQALAQLDAITKARGLVYTQGAALFGDRTDRTLEQALDEIASGVRPGAGASARVRSTLDAGGITSLQGLVDALNKADQIDAFTESVRRATLAITDADALALEDQEKVAQARLAQARELGLDIADVERLNGLERTRLVEQQAAEQTRIAEEAAAEQKRIAEAEAAARIQASQDAFALILSGAEENRRLAEEQARLQAASTTSFLQSIVDSVRSAADAMIAEANRLREEVDAALLGQYSPLSPEARLALAGDRFRAGSLGLNDYLAEGARAYGTATTAYADFFSGALDGARGRAVSLDAAAAQQYANLPAVLASVRSAPGFATGGSFDVPGPAGNDNVYLPSLGARFERGETVNVSRRDTMSALLDEMRATRAVLERLLQANVGIGSEQLAQFDQLRRSFAGMEAIQRTRKAAG